MKQLVSYLVHDEQILTICVHVLHIFQSLVFYPLDGYSSDETDGQNILSL